MRNRVSLLLKAEAFMAGVNELVGKLGISE